MTTRAAATGLLGAAAVLGLLVPGAAQADPNPGAPQFGAPCTGREIAGASTLVPGNPIALACAGGAWREGGSDPVSDRWYSYGTPLRLGGVGTKPVGGVAPDGHWLGYPQNSDTVCAAVVYPGVPGEPSVPRNEPQPTVMPSNAQPVYAQAAPGKRLEVDLGAPLAAVDFNGVCVWQRDLGRPVPAPNADQAGPAGPA